MKKFMFITFTGALTLGFVSCGGEKAGDEKVKEEEVEKSSNPFQALSNMGKAMEKSVSSSEEKIKERRAKGDTLAIPYEELMKYLPESIEGYSEGKTDGSTVNMMGASFSNAKVKFCNDKNECIKIELVDYNSAYNIYYGLTSIWAIGMSIDTPDKKANGVKFEGDIAGWEEFNKKNKDATVFLGIGYRFWLKVEADNQTDTEYVKSIAKSMDLNKLANM